MVEAITISTTGMEAMGVMEVDITQVWEWVVMEAIITNTTKVTSSREEITKVEVVAHTVDARWVVEAVVSVILLTSLTTQSFLALQSI